MVNKTNFCLDVLILRSYLNTAERFTLSYRISTNAIETSAKTFQTVVWEILRHHGYLVNPLIGKRIQQQQQQQQAQHQSQYQMRLRNPPKH